MDLDAALGLNALASKAWERRGREMIHSHRQGDARLVLLALDKATLPDFDGQALGWASSFHVDLHELRPIDGVLRNLGEGWVVEAGRATTCRRHLDSWPAAAKFYLDIAEACLGMTQLSTSQIRGRLHELGFDCEHDEQGKLEKFG